MFFKQATVGLSMSQTAAACTKQNISSFQSSHRVFLTLGFHQTVFLWFFFFFLLMLSYEWSLVTSPNPYKLKLNESKNQKQSTKNNQQQKHASLITNYLLKTEQAMENK